MRKKVDRNIVPQKAGVSLATVSRVFNSPGLVAKSKREAVLAAVRELNYTPSKNVAASGPGEGYRDFARQYGEAGPGR